MEEVGNGSFNLVPTDAGDLYDLTLMQLQDAVGEPLYPGDERRMFAEALVAVLNSAYNSINDAALQTTLQHARGRVLDAIGERLGVFRLGGDAATCILRFTLSAPQPKSVYIPKWTKATADSQVYFATDYEAEIPPGEISVDVPATATGTGAMGNGYPPGSVATLVNLIAYVSTVENVDESAGGDDGEPYTQEGDARFRERILIAPEKLSVAGPEMAYVYWAMTADARIADVAAISEVETFQRELPVYGGRAFMGGDLLIPDHVTVDGQDGGFSYEYGDSLLTITLGPELAERDTVTVRIEHKMDGRVRIVPLLEGGGIPDDEVLQRVYNTVNARDVRPMTDLVTVEAPTQMEFGIDLVYWVSPESEAQVIEAVDEAIAQYIRDQTSKLGRDINPDVLTAYIVDAGAIRAEIAEPEWLPVEDGEVAVFNGQLNVSHKLETRARWER